MKDFLDLDADQLKKVIIATAAVLILLVAVIEYFRKEHEKPEILEGNEIVEVKEVPGMKLKPMVVSRNGIVIPLRVQSSTWCYEGDLDIIQKELHFSENKRLLVTLEPIFPDSTDIEPKVYELTLRQIMLGTDLQFVLPIVNRPHHLGIFFCKDSTNEGRCATKKWSSFEQVHELYSHGEPPEDFIAEDRIYYFSYALLGYNWVGALDNQMKEEGYTKLAEYLRKEGWRRPLSLPLSSVCRI